jgi:hypothetical protein
MPRWIELHVGALDRPRPPQRFVVYRTQSQWPGILREKSVGWGQKPRRAFGFAELFHRP